MVRGKNFYHFQTDYQSCITLKTNSFSVSVFYFLKGTVLDGSTGEEEDAGGEAQQGEVGTLFHNNRC